MTVTFEATRCAFIDQSHVVESVMADVADLGRDTRLEGWDCGVLAYHMAALSLNLPRLIGSVDDDWPAIDVATWASGTKGFADEVDQMSLALAAKRTHDEIRTRFAEYAVAGRAFVDSASGDLKFGFPAWKVWLPFSEFLLTRVVELTVHGLDLADAAGSERPPAPSAVEVTTQWLDTQIVGRRPADLDGDVAWIEAATARVFHQDERLPVLA